jgi:hypothetical protein
MAKKTTRQMTITYDHVHLFLEELYEIEDTLRELVAESSSQIVVATSEWTAHSVEDFVQHEESKTSERPVLPLLPARLTRWADSRVGARIPVRA